MKEEHGLILEPLAPEDFVLGSERSLAAKFGRSVIKPDGKWGAYMENEPQAPRYETNACASFGTLTSVEALKRFLFDNLPDFSDRFLAKASDTDPSRGNTPKKVADTLRKMWSVFEQEWPASVPTLQEFYADIPNNLRTLAIGRGAEFEFGYEYIGTSVASIKYALTLGTASMSVPAWFKDENGKYYRPEGQGDTHWVAIQEVNDKGEIVVKDTYEPYDKVMRADFTPQMALGYYLNRQVKGGSGWARFLQLLMQIVFGEPKETAVVTVDHTVPPAPERPRLLWDTPADARHSTRVICDEMGLTLQEKNLICAVIMAESGFKTQAINRNRNSKGEVISTDYGICQINDYWNIGPGKPFSSITEVLGMPEKSVRFMITMLKAKKLNLWWAYKNGSYLKYL